MVTPTVLSYEKLQIREPEIVLRLALDGPALLDRSQVTVRIRRIDLATLEELRPHPFPELPYEVPVLAIPVVFTEFNEEYLTLQLLFEEMDRLPGRSFLEFETTQAVLHWIAEAAPAADTLPNA